MKIRPSENRVVVKVLEEKVEEVTPSGIITPVNKNVTKELAIGEVIKVDDPKNVAKCEIGEKILFRSMAGLQCGSGLAIINVSHVEGVIEEGE